MIRLYGGQKTYHAVRTLHKLNPVLESRTMKDDKQEEIWTMSVPEAGRKYFGVGRNRAYAMANEGIIPTVDVGPRLKRALVRVIERKLAGDKD
jgi:hypothetical protein